MPRCIDCSRVTMKTPGKFNERGLGLCALKPKFTFVPLTAQRDCKDFAARPAAEAAKAEAWLASRQADFRATILAADAAHHQQQRRKAA